jgi:type I restriction enzyme, S subunit
MNTYPSYKEIGFEWIGEIPNHWDIKRIKYTSSFQLSGVDRITSETEINVSICHYPDVYNNESIFRRTKISKGTCTPQELDKFCLRLGDILITKDSESPSDIGVPCYVEENIENTVCGYHLGQYRISDKMSPKYVFRFIQSDFVQSYFETESNGITRFGLGKPSLENLELVIPPLQEQHQISNYLDHKIQQIDSLIEKTQQKIELLKEQRKSLINQVVTKGLNPDDEMKDSGVEWIGKIPSGWDVVSIKRLCSVKRGSSPRPIDDPKYFDERGEFRWVRISDVSSSERYLEKTTQVLSELGSSLSTKRYPGDIFLSIAGSVGKPIISKIKCCIHDGFVWFDDLNLDSEYLYYIFSLGQCFQGLGKFGTQLNLNTETVGSIKIPLMTHIEQQLIVDHLDKETTKIDSTIEKEHQRTELLKEYRQSLISEVVTGKVDVRDEVFV